MPMMECFIKPRSPDPTALRGSRAPVARGVFSREAGRERGGDILIEFRLEPGAAKGIHTRLFESEFPGLFENGSQAVLQALPVLASKTPEFPPIRVSAGANIVEHAR